MQGILLHFQRFNNRQTWYSGIVSNDVKTGAFNFLLNDLISVITTEADYNSPSNSMCSIQI